MSHVTFHNTYEKMSGVVGGRVQMHYILLRNTPYHTRMSHVITRMSHVITRMSHVITRMSHDITRMSHVITRMSHVITRMSHFMYERKPCPDITHTITHERVISHTN